MTAEEETIVRRVRLELEKLYGDRLRKVILYGSRARGDAHEESDYDFLAVLDEVPDYWAESGRLSDLTFDLLMETGAFIVIRPGTAAELDERTLFMENVRREGMPV